MTEQTDTPPPPASRRRRPVDFRRPQVRGGAVVAVALLIGFGVWLAVRGGGSSSKSPVPGSATAVPINAGGLRTLASAVGQPIYWAGPRPNLQYELTRSQDGRVWIRYLPLDQKIGEQSTPYLTIGTYPVANAYGATKSVADRKDSTLVPVGNGAIAFYSAAHPTSVYLAYRGSNYQVEVFDPSASEARQLVSAGRITAVKGGSSSTTGPQGGAVALDENALKQRAAAASGPIYWVGPQSNVTYELTQASDGRAYVRYLPKGVQAGSTKRYLTVGTYPLENAMAATKVAAQGNGSVTLEVAHGGFGFYNQSTPTNVHLAYPGKNFQIEVFDPSPQRAHQLASSGRLRPVG